MSRLALAALAAAAVLACTAPAVADSGQWAGPGTEREYCADLLEWGRQHPEIPEFDGWPAYCRATYPDLTTTTSTTVPFEGTEEWACRELLAGRLDDGQIVTDPERAYCAERYPLYVVALGPATVAVPAPVAVASLAFTG